MGKKYWIAIAAVAAVAVACVAVWFWQRNVKVDNPAAQIMINGEIVKVLPLDEDCEFTVECENGYNVVTVKNGTVCVSDADCPDKVCVSTGAISGGAIPIVCLPHRLEVVVVGVSSEFDAKV